MTTLYLVRAEGALTPLNYHLTNLPRLFGSKTQPNIAGYSEIESVLVMTEFHPENPILRVEVSGQPFPEKDLVVVATWMNRTAESLAPGEPVAEEELERWLKPVGLAWIDFYFRIDEEHRRWRERKERQ